MLTREIMGALALAILWVNALLVAAASVKRARALGRMARSFGAVERGAVVLGAGPDGAIAAVQVVHVGRLAAGRRRLVVFHERSRSGIVHGGRIVTASRREVDVPQANDAEVWLDRAAFVAAARCPSDARFDAACADGRKARGLERPLLVPIALGNEVFVGNGLLATFDPAPWVRRRVALAYGFALAEVAVAAGCSAAALVPPAFGPVSTAGAAAGFIFFLLVQPLGTAVRDALRTPAHAPLRDTWSEGVGASRPAHPGRSA